MLQLALLHPVGEALYAFELALSLEKLNFQKLRHLHEASACLLLTAPQSCLCSAPGSMHAACTRSAAAAAWCSRLSPGPPVPVLPVCLSLPSQVAEKHGDSQMCDFVGESAIQKGDRCPSRAAAWAAWAACLQSPAGHQPRNHTHAQHILSSLPL